MPALLLIGHGSSMRVDGEFVRVFIRVSFIFCIPSFYFQRIRTSQPSSLARIAVHGGHSSFASVGSGVEAMLDENSGVLAQRRDPCTERPSIMSRGEGKLAR